MLAQIARGVGRKPSLPTDLVSRHVTQHEGFKDALRALACLKHPEEEHKDVDEPLRDLFFNYILISPELEGVREMAWLEAKVRTLSPF